MGDSSDFYPENWGWVFKKFRCFIFIYELSLSLSRQSIWGCEALLVASCSKQILLQLDGFTCEYHWNFPCLPPPGAHLKHKPPGEQETSYPQGMPLFTSKIGRLSVGMVFGDHFFHLFFVKKWGSNMGLNLKKFRYQ